MFKRSALLYTLVVSAARSLRLCDCTRFAILLLTMTFAALSSMVIAQPAAPIGPESGTDNVYWSDKFGMHGSPGPVAAAAADSSGNLYVATGNNVLKWDGASWTALGSGMSGDNDEFSGYGPAQGNVFALAVNGTDLYAGGSFTKAGGVSANYIAKWNGTSWSPVGTGMGGATNVGGSNYTGVLALSVSGGNLYAGGCFTTAGGMSAKCIAKWNGATWSGLGSGISGGAVCTIAASGTNVYAAGIFTTAGGVSANNVAKWNGKSWSALGSGITGPQGGDLPSVNALAVSGDDLYAGGWFSSAGGVSANGIAKWNGTSWLSLGSGLDSGDYTEVRALAVKGGVLYAGGYFETAAGSDVNNIAMWDGTSWSRLDKGINGNIYGGDYAPSDEGEVCTLVVSGNVLYVGGKFITVGEESAYNIAAWDGASWSGVGNGTGASYGMDGDVYAFAVCGTDVYVGGHFTIAGETSASCVAKWNGTSWSTLGGGMGLDDPDDEWGPQVKALAVSPSGDLYAAGHFTTAGRVSANDIAKWNGTSWSALGSGMDGDVYALAVSASDVYAAGSFTTAGGVSANNIAKWNGTSWSALGSGLAGQDHSYSPCVAALAMSGNGDLYAAGHFTTAGGVSANNIAKWNGTSWSALGSGITDANPYLPGYVIVDALALSGSDLYAGGWFATAGGVSANNIAKWDGTAWSALGSGTAYHGVEALAVSGSGDLYAGGSFWYAGGVPMNCVARWDGTSWSTLGSGVNIESMDTGVHALAVSGSDLYAGGSFARAGEVNAECIARWDGTAWSLLNMNSFNGGIDDPVYAVATSGSDVYVGGCFSMAGGVSAWNIAKWNGTSWSALGSGIASSWLGVDALAVSGSNVYAGGEFTSAGGLSAKNIAKWDGTSWSALGGGVGRDVLALAVSGNGDVYAGGSFTTAGGVSANGVAKWDGSSWSALGSGVNGDVCALAVSTNGDLYVGGAFTTAGGVSANRVAKWDGSSWTALGTGVNDSVYALAVFGNDLYAGGYFTTAGGVSASHIAKWDGTSWSTLGSGMDKDVFTLAVSENGDLYAGGHHFNTAGGVKARHVAKWDGMSWSALGSGIPDGRVDSLAVSGNTLFVGGQFRTAGAKQSNYFAVWQPRVDVFTADVSATPGVMTIGNAPFGFYKPALMTGSGTTASYSGGLPATVTLNRAAEIQVGGKRVNGAFTLSPAGVQFGGDGAVVRVEFSEDDVALSGGDYTQYRAASLTYPTGYPTTKEAATRTLLPGQQAPAPIRIENGKQIYAILAPVTEIGGAYGAIRQVSGIGSLRVSVTPSAVVSAGAKWQLDGDGVWRNNGATVSGLVAGMHTVSFNSIPRYTSPANQSIQINANQTATATGVYTAIPVGSLRVTITPSKAGRAGAKWQVDGDGVWRSSGSTVSGLVPGMHTVSFKSISSYAAPSNQNVQVNANQTATITGAYTSIPVGSLKVTITPSRAGSAGARWQVDGDGVWRTSGATVSGLSVATHSITFKAVTGYTTPANQNVQVNANQTTTATGAYVASSTR